MNKQYAIEILNEVSGFSKSYVMEYGISIVKEAYQYLNNLYDKQKKKNNDIRLLLDKTYDLIF